MASSFSLFHPVHPLKVAIAAAALAGIGAGCTGASSAVLPNNGGTSAITTPPTAMQVITATSTQCPSGGVNVVVFQDISGDGKLNAADPIESQSPICNGATGATGAQGEGAGVAVTSASPGACPAGGTVITTFVDANNNGTLDTGETVTSVSAVCNGTNGTNGANGTNGVDGQSAAITVTAATSAQCAAGGAVYTSTSPGSAAQTTVICDGSNGANGTNAVFETGPVGGPVAGEAFSACHHDYLYIPDSTGGDRGWLLFRHQDNGADDEGIGSTGFEVWDVDIASFELVSEVGDVVYCSLTWDPDAKILSYTVIDNTNGLAGQTGSIQM